MRPLLSAISLLSWPAAPSMLAERGARLGQRLAQLAGLLAGQRLLGLGVLRPDLHGDEAERVGQRIELGEGLVELGRPRRAAAASALWMAPSCLAMPASVVLRLRIESLTAWMLSGLSSSFSRSTVVPAFDSSSCAEVEVTCRNEAPSRISG